MAEESLYLVDQMSPSLRRIAEEADRLNRRMVSLERQIRSLEKPTKLTRLRRELKEVQKEAKLTEKALKDATLAEQKLRAGYSASRNKYLHQRLDALKQENLRKQQLFYGPNKEYSDARNKYLHQRLDEMRRQREQDKKLRDQNKAIFGDPLRRDRIKYQNGRILDGLTFEERVQRRLNEINPKRNLEERVQKVLNRMTPERKHNMLMDSFSKNVMTTNLSLQKFSNTLIHLGALVGSVGLIFGALKGAATTVIEPTSRYMSNYMRTSLTSDRQLSTKDMMGQLYDTAIRTRSDAQGTMMLYNRIAMSGVKASNEDIRRFVETFNKTMMISGTSGQENKAVMLQLAQGMGSNRLGGDEFRSIAEQAPMFKYMLAKGLSVNPGALKQMGAEGKLTADTIMQAMKNVQDLVDTIAENAPLTIDQTLIIMQTRWERFLNSSMVGYIAIRDLLKQISDWMATTKGEETMTEIVSIMNMAIFRTIQFFKMMTGPVLFILTHLRQIGKTIRNIGILAIIANWQILVNAVLGGLAWIQRSLIFTISSVGQLGYALLNVGGFAKAGMSTAATSIRAVGTAIHSWIPELLAVLAIMLAITKVLPAIKREIQVESYINKGLEAKGFSKEDIGKASAYQVQQKGFISPGQAGVKMTKGSWAALEEAQKLRQQYAKDNPREGTEEYYKKISDDAMKQFEEILKKTEGSMDSFKNIPMDPSKSIRNVGKVGEVGRINEDVKLNTEGIQMMKAIAERQWYMQNEVTVPQKVEITVDKSTNVDPESLAESLNQGMQIAIASSMRGEAMA